MFIWRRCHAAANFLTDLLEMARENGADFDPGELHEHRDKNLSLVIGDPRAQKWKRDGPLRNRRAGEPARCLTVASLMQSPWRALDRCQLQLEMAPTAR